MTKPGWREIKEGLRHSRPDATMPAPGEFWADFRARASLRHQERVVTSTALSSAQMWVLASVCAAVVAAWIGFRAIHGGPDRGLSTIKSFQVLATHSAVMMVEDESTRSTVLWIVDMDSDDA